MKRNMVTFREALSELDIRSKSLKKGISSFKGWHKIVGLYFFFVGLFNKSAKRRFYEDFWNALGSVVYVPQGRLPVVREQAPTVVHELCHVIQSEREESFMRKYISLNAKYRWRYEMEAYIVGLLCYARQLGGAHGANDRLNYALIRSRKDHAYHAIAGTYSDMYKMRWGVNVDADLFEHVTEIVLSRGLTLAFQAYDKERESIKKDLFVALENDDLTFVACLKGLHPYDSMYQDIVDYSEQIYK
jgi:hypothetical protein